MSIRVKRSILLICFGLITALFSACSGPANEANKETNKTAGTTQTETGAPQEKVKLVTSLWDLENYPNSDKSVLKKKLEDQLGVDITLLSRKGDTYTDDYKLEILSGNPPDYFTNLTLTDYNEYFKQDLLAEIPEEFVAEHAPNLLAYYKKHVGEHPFSYSDRDGKNYGLPLISPISKFAYVNAIREDWLNNVGITKLPETIDELHEALLRFRNDDPDKDGNKNTYGWSLAIVKDSVNNMFSPIFGAYGVYPGIMYDNNGKIVAGEIEPGAKQALQVLSQWYKEEIIDPEFVVMTKWELLLEKFVASKAGFINRGFWEIVPVFGPAPFSNDLNKVTPGAKVTLVNHPKGPNGDFGDTQGNPVSGSMLAFKKGLSPQVMAKYLEFFDTVIFDKEMVEFSMYGEEGINYNKTAEGYEWIAPYDDQTERAKANIGLSFGKHMSDFDMETQMAMKPEVKPLYEDAVSKAVGKYDILAPTLRPLKDQYSTDLGMLTQKTYIDIITGKKSIDEFDNFVKEWKEKGGEKMIEESQKVYDEIFK